VIGVKELKKPFFQKGKSNTIQHESNFNEADSILLVNDDEDA
jgi:hypothetical protein